MIGLVDLPVELFYELQLFALSESLPITSRYINAIFRSAPISFRVEYLFGRLYLCNPPNLSLVMTKALRYPLCTEEVLESLVQRLPITYGTRNKRFDLPRRLFKSLAPKSGPVNWKEQDYPLPFLRYLFDLPMIPRPNVDAYGGYALTKAVHAKFVPLIQFLLSNGADPQCNDHLSIIVAIRQKDLTLVKMLIERYDSPYEDGKQGIVGRRKRRRLEDRVEVKQPMLRWAVKRDARDIAEYFMSEKGCVPDIHTLRFMAKHT